MAIAAPAPAAHCTLSKPLHARKHLPPILTSRSQRTFADARSPDKTVLPGTASHQVAGVPQPPIAQSIDSQPTANSDIPISGLPRVPPTPAEADAAVAKEAASTPAASAAPAPTAAAKNVSPNHGNLPPTGYGTAATGPTGPIKPKPRRFRRFLLTLIVLSALGYAGGVYYALNSDNFHDFFTEYVPGGEDAVAYFEEREFRRRFPSRPVDVKNWPQMRGENKVTIGKSSGLTAKATDESDLGSKGPHMGAKADPKPQPEVAQRTPEKATSQEKVKAVESAKKDQPKAAPAPAPAAPAPKPAVATVDHVNVAEATEPVVQELVKMVNNIITAVNASSEAGKLSSTVSSAKSDLEKIIGAVSTLKERAAHDAQTQIQNAHTEFDGAAKELVRRLEQEMRETESKWREEYESERESLSNQYNQRLEAELDASRRVTEEKNKNALLEQEINLQKTFSESVKAKIEEERDGRLSKIDDLSNSVSELEKLSSSWSEVVDSNLRTQHLQVALESVRNAVLHADHPTPFINELVALKEVSKGNDVVNAAIASINPAAYQRGIPTPANLIDRFRRVASEVRKASLLPEDAGIASHAASAVLSKMMFTKKGERGLPSGDDVEATLARTEVLLEEGDLESATREMNGLKGWAGVLSRDWVAETRRVLEVRQAVDVSDPNTNHTVGLRFANGCFYRLLLPKPVCRACSSGRRSRRCGFRFVVSVDGRRGVFCELCNHILDYFFQGPSRLVTVYSKKKGKAKIVPVIRYTSSSLESALVVVVVGLLGRRTEAHHPEQHRNDCCSSITTHNANTIRYRYKKMSNSHRNIVLIAASLSAS
jgi:mitofilin